MFYIFRDVSILLSVKGRAALHAHHRQGRALFPGMGGRMKARVNVHTLVTPGCVPVTGDALEGKPHRGSGPWPPELRLEDGASRVEGKVSSG